MDWTFWVAAVVIVGLVVWTQVAFHESRWSRRQRDEQVDDTGGRADAAGGGRPDSPDAPDSPEAPDSPDSPGPSGPPR